MLREIARESRQAAESSLDKFLVMRSHSASMPSSLLLPLVCDIEFTPPRLAARRPPRHDRRVLELTALVVRDRVHIRLASALSAVAASTARASGQCADVDCDGGRVVLLSSATAGAHCDGSRLSRARGRVFRPHLPRSATRAAALTAGLAALGAAADGEPVLGDALHRCAARAQAVHAIDVRQRALVAPLLRRRHLGVVRAVRAR